jgi:hypothetical protein
LGQYKNAPTAINATAQATIAKTLRRWIQLSMRGEGFIECSY